MKRGATSRHKKEILENINIINSEFNAPPKVQSCPFQRKEFSMKAEIKPRINLEGRTRLEEMIPLSTPMVLFVDPASVCNFQCAFCPTGDRELIKGTGRFVGRMKFELFKKVIDDLADFDRPIKVLRMYKDGEPFLNNDLAKMIEYAKQSNRVDYIDTTTNGSLLKPERMGPIIKAGLDKINISIDGMNREQYLKFTNFDFNFGAFVENVKWLYENKNQCEIVIKIPKQLITEAQQKTFFDTFGDYCDRISLENFAPCWPDFNVEARTGVTITEGIYNQPISYTETCPYIFYGMSVNADGLVSSCFLDWERKLLVGDVRTERLVDIWNSDRFNKLRLQHLDGKRRENTVCSKCGQLSHCLPDNIDPYRNVLVEKFKSSLAKMK
jgi:radical SAM protein with 4Fe4S-binding SPASM domain